MKFRLVVRPEVDADLLEAETWYEQQQAGLGRNFLRTVRKKLAALPRNPFLYRVRRQRRQVRWAYPRPFPYRIIFRVVQDKVVVYAVLHAARTTGIGKAEYDKGISKRLVFIASLAERLAFLQHETAMAILIDEKKRVLVQGITGREGRARTRLMREYGTNVVAGVTPGKGGQSVLGVPVFNKPQEAVNSLGEIDISVVFVPAAGVKDAAVSAIDAGIKLTVLVPDRVPVWDAMEIAAAAKANGAMFLGPNTLGALSPGKGVVGMIGGRAESARHWFKPGVPKGVGVISRSGGMASSTGYYLGQAGVRISTIVHIGGDAVIGIRLPDAALMFEGDPLTEAIVIFGEIGSSQEEELAQLIVDRKVIKPVIAYIGGKAAREGTRFSHAGAIIEGGRGTHADKVKALREAGATVVDAFGELPDAVVKILKNMKGKSLMSEIDKNAVWNTAITRVEPNKVAVRGYDIAELMGRVSFGAAVYLILTGELPLPAVARLMDAILVSSIDHGATPPSALAARSVASTGATLSASVAAGIMSINRHHGGAIEDCARQLRAIADRATRESISMDEAAARTLAVMRETGERMPGFGHRLHTKDPRTARLFELAREAGVDGVHMQAARAVEKAFADAKKSLPINVDGAIGAILVDLGMDPAAFNGIFMIARTPGLVAHVIEEQTREKPMRRIDPVNHGYDGPPARSLSLGPVTDRKNSKKSDKMENNH